MKRADIVPPVKGAHALRHTAATEMLRHGVPLDKIGLVLRHRGIDTTAYLRKGRCRAAEAGRSALAGGALMLNAIETYLALRRATGFAMSTAEYLLKSFAAFAAERGQTYVETQTAIDWAALGPSVAQRDARLKAVCRFVRHVRVEDARHELPPANHFGARKRRRTPHIYTTDEIGRLVEAALRLRPMGGLRPHTLCDLDRAALGHRVADLRSPEADDRRRDQRRSADPRDQVPQDATGAAARHGGRRLAAIPDPSRARLRR